MSVLRKRSPWFIPAASLLLGALTLGLAGCGGGDDDPFGNPDPGTGAGVQNFGIPQELLLGPQQAQASQGIGAGQGGTISATNLNAGNFGGVTGVTITLPPGAVTQPGTYGLTILPASQGTINRIRNGNANALQGLQPVAEILFGLVNPDGTINVAAAPDSPANTDITLTEAQSNFLLGQLGGNRGFQAFRIVGNVAAADNSGAISLENGVIRIRNLRPGHILITIRPRAHIQGGGGS